eukprot:7627863-Pyramimonas_sp.AAC.1
MFLSCLAAAFEARFAATRRTPDSRSGLPRRCPQVPLSSADKGSLSAEPEGSPSLAIAHPYHVRFHQMSSSSDRCPSGTSSSDE